MAVRRLLADTRAARRRRADRPALLTLGAEFAAVLAAGLWLARWLRWAACLGVIGAACPASTCCWPWPSRSAGTTGEWGSPCNFGFDIAQMSAVLFLTGGVLNPFCLPTDRAGDAGRRRALRGRYACHVGGLAARL